MKKLFYLPFIVFTLLFTYCSDDDNGNEPIPKPPFSGPVDVEKTNPMKVYVHYMPWFETPETNGGNWGLHWTMATANPNNTDEEGKREIASYYYPSIGPYASNDKDVIEYHLLLIKYAGIDGLIIDWYGSYDVNDYRLNRNNTEAIIKQVNNVGLGFAITYEDQTTNQIVEKGLANDNVEAATVDFIYMANNYFNSSSYIKIEDKPLLTVFGPQAITNGDDWSTIFEKISQTPKFLSLWYESAELGNNGAGEFSWVYENNSHILNFYNNQMSKLDVKMGSAYPGFKDYYAEGNWGDGMGWIIEHNNGETLQATLDMAKNASPDYLQLVTWNDFGEGTMIEPTDEFGYSFLKKIQAFTGTPYNTEVFDYISKLYKLRKNKASDSVAQDLLDQAFQNLVQLKFDEAKAIIDGIQ